MSKNRWFERTGWLLRWSLAVVFAWFGAMKLLDQCPLADFVGRTVNFLPQRPFLLVLGCWEVAIAACLLVRRTRRLGLVLLLLHLPGTMLPFVVLPDECFTHLPVGLTLAGQYIVKNLVLGSAALVLLSRTGKRSKLSRTVTGVSSVRRRVAGGPFRVNRSSPACTNLPSGIPNAKRSCRSASEKQRCLPHG